MNKSFNTGKKALCLLLLLAMLLSLSAAAFAEEYVAEIISDSANEAMDEIGGGLASPQNAASPMEQENSYAAGHFSSAAEFISDEAKSTYIDRMTAYYIESGELQGTLNAGQPVLMFFEGGSDIGKCEAAGERTGAVCLVIRNDGTENYIAYYCKLCSTLPDYPFGYSYANGHDNYGAATLLDGIYQLYTVNHRGIYAGFNARTGNNICVPCVYMNSDGGFSVLNGNGINIHTRLDTTVSGDVSAPYSAGCITVAGSQPFDAYLEFLQQAVPDTSALIDTQFGGGDIKKYDTAVTPQDTAAGVLVMDRYLAREAMSAVYGGNGEAVSCITAFSAEAQADEAAGSACLETCTVYPSYLAVEVKAGTALSALPQKGDAAAITDGRTLTVSALYENAAGEYWYRVYYCGGYYYLDSSDAWDIKPVYDDISIHNYNYPEVKQYKKAFSVWGIVASKYNELKSVNGYILSDKGETECLKSVTSILRSYSIDASDGWVAYRYSLDNLMAFSGLSLGEHEYKISATVDNYYVSAEGLKCDTQEIVLVDKLFRVAAKVQLDANGGTVEPESLFTDSNGCIAELPVPVKDKFVFVGWQTTDGKLVTAETRFTVNDTVTAQWKSAAVLSSESAEYSAEADAELSFTVALKNADGAPIAGAALMDKLTGASQITDENGAAVFTCRAEEGTKEHTIYFGGDETYAEASLTVLVTGEGTEAPVPSEEPDKPADKDTPDTGDNTAVGLLLTAIAASSLGLAYAVRRRDTAE